MAVELTTEQARRLQSIIEVLATRASTYSHALPHGRGGKDLAARNDVLDAWRREAINILTGIMPPRKES